MEGAWHVIFFTLHYQPVSWLDVANLLYTMNYLPNTPIISNHDSCLVWLIERLFTTCRSTASSRTLETLHTILTGTSGQIQGEYCIILQECTNDTACLRASNDVCCQNWSALIMWPLVKADDCLLTVSGAICQHTVQDSGILSSP